MTFVLQRGPIPYGAAHVDSSCRVRICFFRRSARRRELPSGFEPDCRMVVLPTESAANHTLLVIISLEASISSTIRHLQYQQQAPDGIGVVPWTA